jgi:gas vesicle protein
VGAILGATVALLMAPASGDELAEELERAAADREVEVATRVPAET